jgi:uncharacterized protein YlxP (DUF503 family)
MHVGVLQVTLHLPESGSLKAKRQVVGSLLQQVRNQFAVGAAEVGAGDRWQLAELGFVCVSNDARHADEILSRLLRFIEGRTVGGMLAQVRTEVLTLK